MSLFTIALLVTFVFGFAVCKDHQTIALNFLGRYGYLTTPQSSDLEVARAIGKFQAFYGLKVSGNLDDSTVNLMKKPRCGVPDTSGDAIGKRYSTNVRWRINHLTYYVQPGKDLSPEQQRETFAKAFDMWADVADVTFSEVSSASNAYIKISFGFGRHKGTSAEKTCGTVFDGYGGTLAHAFYPEDGRIHFDESEKFTLNSGFGTNLLWVAVHEIGHVLGLDHTNVKGAIMHPIYSDDIQEVKLHSDDIAGMQYLYGKKGATPAPTKPGKCKDQDPHLCKAYQDNGYCESEYKDVMEEMCPKTCYDCNV